jgi:transcription-repair coupling factor (superfamily II helicase)
VNGYSNIVIKKEGEQHQPAYDEMIKLRNNQEEICKLVFNMPTFDRITSIVGDNDFVISEKKTELERITKYFEEKKVELSEVEKNNLANQIKTLNLQTGFILPDDTMAFITKWAMGDDVSDIKKTTKESFLRAASLAKAHNKAPSDYLSGVFTDFNKREIDTYAFVIFEEHMEERRVINGGKHTWFLGGRGKKIELPKRPGGK